MEWIDKTRLYQHPKLDVYTYRSLTQMHDVLNIELLCSVISVVNILSLEWLFSRVCIIM